MLEARVFTLGVLTNDTEVDILVAGLVTRNVLDENNGCVDVELLTKGDIERLMTRALNWGVEDT